MSAKSSIEWTDATWNPVRGCLKISPGCKHCYAATFAERFRGVRGHPYEKGFDPRLVPEKLAEPLRWAKPKTIFVNSMSDLFQDNIPDWYIENVCKVMEMANWHTYQVLTKRSMRMSELLLGKLEFAANLKHVWWGVSVEDRRFGIPRVEELRASKAKMRFLSVEPLLEDLPDLNVAGLNWVIVGGESGPGARLMDIEWVLNILELCQNQNIPFFFKQWGGVRKSKAGRTLIGRTFDEMPAKEVNPIPSTETRNRMIREVLSWNQTAETEKTFAAPLGTQQKT